ncbi:MAG: efflux RND transporter permease subunit [Gemmatimonadales bacterium]
MLNALIRWSLRNRMPVLGLAALVLAGGVLTAIRLPVDVFPDLTAPTVTVLAEAHQMAAEEVETLVTFPIETAVNGASGVRRVRSSTAHGIAVIWVEFDWGIDIFRARQIVAEKLQTVTAALPSGVAPPLLAPVSSVMGEIMMVGLRGPDQEALRTAADWTVRRRLLAVPGVAQVIPIGGLVRQYQIHPDPVRLQAARVTLGELLDATRAASGVSSGGLYSESGQEIAIRGLARARDAADLAGSAVAWRGGAPIRIGDVATVRIGAAPRIGTGSVNGEPAVVMAVQKQPGANTLELTRRIETELAGIAASLPGGMTVEADLFRQADFIAVAVRNVAIALRDGAVLVVLVLLAFLARWQTTAISVVAIPLSLAVALLAMAALGVAVNTMTLGGLAIAVGVLVDDAIIDVENVFRRLREWRTDPRGRSSLRVVFDASREVRRSILYATAIIIVVFLPLFFLRSVEGRLLQPLGIAYGIATLASLVVALTVTPVLCAFLLPGAAADPRESRLLGWLHRRYRATLRRVMAAPGVVVAIAAAALAATAVSVPFLGTAFLPEFNEGALTISVVTVPGTSLDESDAIGRRVETILLGDDAVRTTDRRQGRAELDEHAQGSNAAEIDVTLAPGTDREALSARLREAFSAIPGTNVTIGQPIGHRIDHLLSGTRANIAVKIFGPDLRQLRQLGTAARDAITPIPGLVDVQLEQQSDVPELRIVADRGALARHGITAGALTETIDVALAGEPAGEILEEDRRTPVVVRGDSALRANPETIGRLPVVAPDGRLIPLAQLAGIRADRGPNTVSRENAQRKIVVQANVAGRDLGGAVAEIREVLGSGLTLPEGYHVEYGGQFEAQQQSVRTIGLVSVMVGVIILLLLFTEFRSARIATLALANLPLALIGGVAAVFATGGIVSVASLVGFVTLFGIATRNGILLLTHYRHLRRGGASLAEAVARGSEERLAPILMTALTAGLALIPLALGGGKPGNEIQTPMAIVILGGLLSSTAMNMVVVPALYLIVERRAARGATQSTTT